LKLAGLEEKEEDLVELSFPLPPKGGRYDLIQGLNDGTEPLSLLKDVDFMSLTRGRR
jgi:hypothetical protein